MQQTNFLYKKLNLFFKLSERKTTIKKEIIGGLSTFLAMMYIFAVNPSMLSQSNGLNIISNPEAGIFLGTVLSSFISTFLMGLFVNVPITLAPGMGLNAFFTFTVASSSGFGLNYFESLVCVFLSGILYAIIAITPARKTIIQILPKSLKTIIIVMIGFFLAYVGLVNIGIVSPSFPATTIGQNFKPTNQNYPVVIIGTICMVISVILYFCKVKHPIIITTVIAIIMLLITWLINKDFTFANNKQSFSLNLYSDFSSFPIMIKTFFNGSSWQGALIKPASYVAILTFLYVDFFDTSGTLFAIGRSSKLINDKKPELADAWIKRANYIDAIGTISGSILLNSSVTVVSESEASIKSGSRTGLSALFTSLLCLSVLAIWPIMGPFMPIGGFQPVTGHSIFLTGLMMIMNIKDFKLKEYLNIPVLAITLIFGMLSYSISSGISWCIFSYVSINLAYHLCYWLRNRNKQEVKEKYIVQELNVFLYVMFFIAILFIVFDIMTKAGVFNKA